MDSAQVPSPFEFYDQFQLKTGGFGTEFGRATGGVINSVTKRGTNKWRVTVGGYYEPESLRGDVPNVEHPSSWRRYDSVDGFDEKDDFDLFVSVGGPAVRDRLFVYGVYDFRTVDEGNYSTYGRMYEDVDDDGFWGVKLDWLLSDTHRIEYTGFSDDSTVKRTAFRWDESTGAVGEELGKTRFNRGGVNHIVAYRGYFWPRSCGFGAMGHWRVRPHVPNAGGHLLPACHRLQGGVPSAPNRLPDQFHRERRKGRARGRSLRLRVVYRRTTPAALRR